MTKIERLQDRLARYEIRLADLRCTLLTISPQRSPEMFSVYIMFIDRLIERMDDTQGQLAKVWV